jgi:hypothetical protein
VTEVYNPHVSVTGSPFYAKMRRFFSALLFSCSPQILSESHWGVAPPAPIPFESKDIYIQMGHLAMDFYRAVWVIRRLF